MFSIYYMIDCVDEEASFLVYLRLFFSTQFEFELLLNGPSMKCIVAIKKAIGPKTHLSAFSASVAHCCSYSK
jgi:hypothetical protein